MENKIKEIDEQIEKFKIENRESLEKFRIQFLGSKNILKDLFAEIKNIAPEKRKAIGQSINSLKNKAQTKLEYFNERTNEDAQENVKIDLSLPGENLELGSRHPLSIVNEKIIDIFGKIGFSVSEGPEVEDDWHNFTGLNLPQEHPAIANQGFFQ